MKSRILAHRGFWTAPSEKNAAVALERAFAAGFGVETDIRDLDGVLVVSHDPPRRRSAPMTAEALFELYLRMGAPGWLALNVKADGLASQIGSLLARYAIDAAFVFDMSAPDMRAYLAMDIPVFTRRSDAEPVPTYYGKCAGVWMDCFGIAHSPADWSRQALSDGKRVALVSPELHGRPHLAAWAEWREALHPHSEANVMICTDYPEEAAAFFPEAV
ncbi:hypothetical protein [Methylocystis parvus]|uniref:hypothetical protein n=1 Tax=Methylocystis parvus TaxID=134 RepID=UPI003C745D04